MNISCHRYPSVILIPLFFCLFLSSFPSLAALYTSSWTFSHRHPISQWILKNIHTYTTRIAQRWSSILFTRFQQGSLAKTGRWWCGLSFDVILRCLISILAPLLLSLWIKLSFTLLDQDEQCKNSTNQHHRVHVQCISQLFQQVFSSDYYALCSVNVNHIHPHCLWKTCLMQVLWLNFMLGLIFFLCHMIMYVNKLIEKERKWSCKPV